MAGYRKRAKGTTEYWELTWVENGKPRTQSLGRVDKLRESEVRELGRRKGRELILREHAVVKPQLDFADWCRQYLEWHASEYPHSHKRVAQIVEQYLLDHFTGTLAGISQLDVERYKKSRGTPCDDGKAPAPGTITKEMRTLKAILNRAVAIGLIDVNPAALVKAPKSLNNRKGFTYFTPEELQRLYTKGCVEEWHRWAWQLYASTGARRRELMNLKWADVGTDTLHLVSTGEERTKSGEGRDVPLMASAIEAFAFFRTWEGKSDLYVLPRVHGTSISRIAARCIRRAGLVGSLHTLRHTFASNLAADPRIPFGSIKEWMGHSTIRVTEQYVHLRDSSTNEIVRGMRL
jgi:integrase